jgi:hypothetical protein
VLVTPSAAIVEDADALTSAAAVLVQAAGAVAEDADTVSADGTVADTTPITADAALTEGDDVVAAFGVAAFPFDPASTTNAYPLVAIATRGRRRKATPTRMAEAT